MKKKPSKTVLVEKLFLISTLLSFAGYFIALFYYGYASTQGITSGFGLHNQNKIINTTIRNVQAGLYNTSIDKQGTGGMLVSISGVKVIGITQEFDGDTHVDISDGRNSLVLELTPVSKLQNVTSPPLNATINVVGVPYCDYPHQQDIWHSQKTCWELHPFEYWSYNNIQLRTGNFTFLPEPSPEP